MTIIIFILSILFVFLFVLSVFLFVSLLKACDEKIALSHDLQKVHKTIKVIKRRSKEDIPINLCTTSQIFQEMSKRGKIIMLIPRRKDNSTFVETLSAQLSPHQTMDVLRVAYTGIADHLVGDEDE